MDIYAPADMMTINEATRKLALEYIETMQESASALADLFTEDVHITITPNGTSVKVWQTDKWIYGDGQSISVGGQKWRV